MFSNIWLRKFFSWKYPWREKDFFYFLFSLLLMQTNGACLSPKDQTTPGYVKNTRRVSKHVNALLPHWRYQEKNISVERPNSGLLLLHISQSPFCQSCLSKTLFMCQFSFFTREGQFHSRNTYWPECLTCQSFSFLSSWLNWQTKRIFGQENFWHFIRRIFRLFQFFKLPPLSLTWTDHGKS